jgi:hypothetical protein
VTKEKVYWRYHYPGEGSRETGVVRSCSPATGAGVRSKPYAHPAGSYAYVCVELLYVENSWIGRHVEQVEELHAFEQFSALTHPAALSNTLLKYAPRVPGKYSLDTGSVDEETGTFIAFVE